MSDQPTSEAEVFTLERVFDAPVELMWDVYTKAEHLSQWFGPPGSPVTVKALDLKPGGVCLYGMAMPGGLMSWGKWVFRQVEPPHTLAYVVSFCTEDGTPVRHPMAPMWPLEVLAVQTFKAEGNGTRMKSRSWPVNATPEERAVFTAGHASMQMGFAGALMALDAYLARMKG